MTTISTEATTDKGTPGLMQAAPSTFPRPAQGDTPPQQLDIGETLMLTPNSITIEVQDRASRDRQLEHVTHLLKNKANDCGILITRHNSKTFTATLSPDVAYGVIQELDLM